jgi:hypothetical protein
LTVNGTTNERTTAISADLEILRHRLGQAVGLGVGMGSISLGPDLALAVKDVDLGPDLSVDKQPPQTRSISNSSIGVGVGGVGSSAVILETAKALAGAEMFGPLYKHTSTDQWSLRWFVLKNFVLYIFKRKPEPNERYPPPPPPPLPPPHNNSWSTTDDRRRRPGRSDSFRSRRRR